MKTKKISPSAQAVAYLRFIEREITNDTLAQYFFSEEGQQLAKIWLKILPGCERAIAVRSRYIEDSLVAFCKSNNINQIINIAAGLTTYKYRMLSEENIKNFVELDLPEMLIFKKRTIAALKGSGIISKKIIETQYVELDLLSDTVIDVLRRIKLDLNEPTFFILEGISYYLPYEKLRNLIDTLYLFCAQKSVIIFDYFPYDMENKRQLGNLMQTITKAGGEKCITYLHPSDIEKLLEKYVIVSDTLTKNLEQNYYSDSKLTFSPSIVIATKL